MQPGKVKTCDRFGAALISSKISFPVGIKLSEAGAQEHDCTRRDSSVSFLPMLEVVFSDQVVRILFTLRGDIHYHAWTHQLLQRDFIDGVLTLSEVDRGIDMGAAMFCRRILVG